VTQAIGKLLLTELTDFQRCVKAVNLSMIVIAAAVKLPPFSAVRFQRPIRALKKAA
jgi:hypothetical protein